MNLEKESFWDRKLCLGKFSATKLTGEGLFGEAF